MKFFTVDLMIYENQQAEILWAMVMAVGPKKKERNCQG